jgi:hypothetical protein
VIAVVMMATVVLVVVMMMVAVLVGQVLWRLGRGGCLRERRGGTDGEQCCDEQGLEGGGHGGDSRCRTDSCGAPNLSSAPGFGRACA